MRLYVISDLHLDFAPFVPPPVAADLVVLAGDTRPKLGGVKWAVETFRKAPVLYVMGNHEFYGEKWPRLIDKARALAAGTNVHILENDIFDFGGWRIFGATLWTDFLATGDLPQATDEAVRSMNDFKRIRHWPSLRRLAPFQVRAAHADTLTKLRAFLEAGDRTRSVVITHHAPSLRSLPDSDRSKHVCAAYASNLDSIIERGGPRYWIHGHIHRQNSYFIGQTQVISNPRGYPDEDGFVPHYTIDLAS